jgi:hypothetical protein
MSSSVTFPPPLLRRFAQSLRDSFPAEEVRQAVESRDNSTLEAIRRDPANTMLLAGQRPDPWQADLLRTGHPRILTLASRQAGKSRAVGAKVLRTALVEPNSLILVLSPTERQSKEFFQEHVIDLYEVLGRPVKPARRPGRLELELVNGSRVVALPDNEAGVRCFSAVRLLVIDEAARVSDDLYFAVTPMLAVSGGKLLALSTPWSRSGWFFSAWESRERWLRVRVPAEMCPRIDPAFLREELASKGERWYQMEYECRFSDLVSSLFSEQSIRDACTDREGWNMEPGGAA